MTFLYCSGLFSVYDLESVKRVNKFSYKLQSVRNTLPIYQ
jgi:hypothetical protein